MAVTLKWCTAYAFLIVVCARRAALVEVPDPAGQVSTAFAFLLQIEPHLIYHIFFVDVKFCVIKAAVLCGRHTHFWRLSNVGGAPQGIWCLDLLPS